MPGNLAGSGESTQEDTILNPFNVLYDLINKFFLIIEITFRTNSV